MDNAIVANPSLPLVQQSAGLGQRLAELPGRTS